MGNRATVIFYNPNENEISPVCDLQLNGGPESIYAFLDELDRRKVRSSVSDVGAVAAELARFTHIVGDYFDSTPRGATALSLYVFSGPEAITLPALRKAECVADDNGLYVVTRGLPEQGQRIVRRFKGNVGIRELTEAEVEAERKAAYKHPYLQPDGIPGEFRRMRPVVSEVG